MGNLSRSSLDLKWDKDAICGRGKAAVVYLVRNTVTKVPQLWKWIHNPNHEASGEHFVLELLQGHDNIQKNVALGQVKSSAGDKIRKWRRLA